MSPHRNNDLGAIIAEWLRLDGRSVYTQDGVVVFRRVSGETPAAWADSPIRPLGVWEGRRVNPGLEFRRGSFADLRAALGLPSCGEAPPGPAPAPPDRVAELIEAWRRARLEHAAAKDAARNAAVLASKAEEARKRTEARRVVAAMDEDTSRIAMLAALAGEAP